jgi:hypothetical protein
VGKTGSDQGTLDKVGTRIGVLKVMTVLVSFLLQ